MANNVTLDAGSGGAVIKTDDDGTAHWQYSKLAFGADNTQTRVTSSSGLPVELLLSTAEIGNVKNSGTFAVQSTLQAGTAEIGKLAAGTAEIGNIKNSGTFAVQSTLQAGTAEIGNVTNSGTFAVQVDSALPAGTNAIGKLSANSGVDIGDVDVTSVIPGTAATNLGKAVDSASGATDTGVAPLAIRDDSLTALAAAENDYVPFRVNSTGALHVTGAGGGTQYQVDDVAGATDTGTLGLVVRDDALTTLTPADGDYTSLRVNSTGALHVTGGGGGTEYNEDDATPATIIGTATLMERDDALSAVTPAEGDWIGFRGTAEGALWTQDSNSDAALAALQIMDDWDESDRAKVNVIAGQAGIAGGTGIDGATVPRVTLATDVALPAGTNAIGKLSANSGVDIGDVDVTSQDGVAAEDAALGNGMLLQGDDGTDRKNVTVDATSGNLQVDVSTALPAGTNAIGKLSANSGVDIGDVDVTSVIPGVGATNLGKAEDAAHSSGDTGVMPLAVRNDDLASLVGTDGDYAPLQVTQNGALLMCPAANDDYKYAIIDAASSGDNTLVAAAGASTKIRVLALFMVSAGTVTARVESGAAGTALTGQMNLIANSGFSLPYNPAGWFETAANTLLNLELSGAISVDGSLTYIEVV